MIAIPQKRAIARPDFNRRSWLMKAFLQLLLPMFLISPLIAQQTKLALRNPEQARKPVESPVKASNLVYRSGSHRDPFLNPLLIKKTQKLAVDEEISRGVPPSSGIGGTYVAQAVLLGTALRENGKVAVVRGADTRSYFLREGDKLFDGYLKKIESDSITLVRETKMKSGKTLTQDVTKRLRTP